MQNIFAGLTAESINLDPFPNIVKENILEKSICEELLLHAPHFFKYMPEQFLPGEKTHVRSRDLLQMRDLPTIYRDFVVTHLKPDFTRHWLSLFQSQIRATHPHLEEKFGEMSKWKIGQRFVDENKDVHLLADAQISFHSPVPGPKPTQERGPHIKECNKLLICQLYLRLPEDKGAGGDFELYSTNNEIKVASKQQVWNRGSIALSKSIKYESNTAIVFLNSPISVQTMSCRAKSNLPLYYLNLILETKEPIFELNRLDLQSAGADKISI